MLDKLNFSYRMPLLFLIFLIISGLSFGQEPLTLDRALEIAMSNSPDIKHAQLSLERSREMLNAQKAALKSQFSLSLTPFNYSHSQQFFDFFSTWYKSETRQSSSTFTISQPIIWTDGTLSLINQFSWRDSYSQDPTSNRDNRSKTYSNDLYLAFRQPLFTYNRTKLELNTLKLDLENAALNYAIQKLFLEYQVTQNFYNVYLQKARLDIAIDEYKNRQESYKIIKNKVDAGLAAQEELYQAELDMTSSKSAVQNAQTQLENLMDSFKKLIGISIFSDITVTADITHRPVKVELQKALDSALKYRMEIRQREIAVENAKYNLIQAAATNEFRGDLSVSYGIIGTDESVNNIFDAPTKNERFSIQFNIPLFDWGQKKSRIKAFTATVKDRELSLDDQKNDIIIQVRQAYRNLQNLVNQIEIANQNVRNAELTYDINLERYKNGDITSMDLNLFQNQLSQAKMNKIGALINYKLELLNLKVLSLYDFEKNKTVVPEIEKL